MEKWAKGVRQGERCSCRLFHKFFFETILNSLFFFFDSCKNRCSRHRQAIFLTLVRSIFFCSFSQKKKKNFANSHEDWFSWTKPQVQARSHPNVLATTVWLNNLYHAQVGEKNEQSANTMKGVDLNTPLTYADRFRIRKPGAKWNLSFNPPHVDGELYIVFCETIILFCSSKIPSPPPVGGTIERWEDPFFRKCFENIFNGSWRDHDPYALEGRLDARTSLYARPSQSSTFRTFKGWLAMRWTLHKKNWSHLYIFIHWPDSNNSSETGPTQGTLHVFPDVLLSNAYIILRPFFSPTVPPNSKEIYDANNWQFGKSPDTLFLK